MALQVHVCVQCAWPPTCRGIIGLLSLDHGASHLNIYLCCTGGVAWWAPLEQCQQGIKEVFGTTFINTLHVTCTSVFKWALLRMGYNKFGQSGNPVQTVNSQFTVWLLDLLIIMLGRTSTHYSLGSLLCTPTQNSQLKTFTCIHTNQHYL